MRTRLSEGTPAKAVHLCSVMLTSALTRVRQAHSSIIKTTTRSILLTISVNATQSMTVEANEEAFKYARNEVTRLELRLGQRMWMHANSSQRGLYIHV